MLRPKVEVGGLDISDGALNFISLHPDTEKISRYSVKNHPEALEQGRVKNPRLFQETLLALHDQITSEKSKKIPVVVSLPDSQVYTQVFSLPPLGGKDLEEAVQLNLQVISPINFSESYSDWERFGSVGVNGHELEIFSSFVEREIVDVLDASLRAAGFFSLAIEQKAVSLARVLNKFVSGFDATKSYLLLFVSGNGLSFSIVKNGSLYFNRFSPWTLISKGALREISFEDFRDLIIQETHRMVNFFSSRFHESIAGLYVAAPDLDEQIRGIVSDNFSIPVYPVLLQEVTVAAQELPAFGAALRGRIPRHSDMQVSLAPQGTEVQFLHSQMTAFVSMWRNITVAVGAVILLAYLGVFLFLLNVSEKLVDDVSYLSSQQNISYLSALQKEAEMFNKNITLALKARTEQTRWVGVLKAIYKEAGTGILIDRFYAQSLDLPIVLNARAAKENLVIDFKNKLEKIPQISRVDLPLASFSPAGDGMISFKISFSADLK